MISEEKAVLHDPHSPCFLIKSALGVPHRPTVTMGDGHLSGKADRHPFSLILPFLLVLLTTRNSEVQYM